MHYKTLITLGSLVISTLAQDSGLNTTLVTLTSTIYICGISPSSLFVTPTPSPATSNQILEVISATTSSFAVMSTSLSNFSQPAVTISSSSVTATIYTNASVGTNSLSSASSNMTSWSTSSGVPTSILFATGTPTAPTITTITVVTPIAPTVTINSVVTPTIYPSSTASAGAASVGRQVSYSGVFMVLLSLSSLLLR